MNSFNSQSFPAGRWDDMCRRLVPLLGDVRKALGRQWHEKAEALFTEADFAVADRILGPSKGPDWYVIRYSSAGCRLDDEGDGLTCAPSWPEAVAVLLGACESNRYLPSHVAYDEHQDVLSLYDGEHRLAMVAPLRVEPMRPQLRRRALSTICGLRKSTDPRTELLKRVRRWPGFSAVAESDANVSHEMQQFRERMAHHPIPQEWLRSARFLCIACGKSEPQAADIQAVAAAALGAQSWNHLAAPHGDASAGLLQPWYLCKDGEDVVGFHADAIDAAAALLDSAPNWMSNWAGAVFESRLSMMALDYTPIYALREQLQSSTPVTVEARQIAAYPIVQAQPPANDALERVLRVGSCRGEDLSTLFGIGLPMNVRAQMLDERSQETLIVQDGPWRFTRTGDRTEGSGQLWVHRLQNDGNSAWSAAVPMYKGLLQTHRRTGLHVLCADYDGAHPVAVIDGLSPLAVARVRAHLPDTTDARMEFRETDRRPRDMADFQKLLNRVTSRTLGP